MEANVAARKQPAYRKFVSTLREMVNDHVTNNSISWSDSMHSIIILDIEEFVNVALPKFFGHNKMKSFIHQLHQLFILLVPKNLGNATLTNSSMSNMIMLCIESLHEIELFVAWFIILAESPVVGCTLDVIIVKAGEDVSSKIMSFSQNGPRGVCIVSAYGFISKVTLLQAATSGLTVTYEGLFEILSLCGSFLLIEDAGQRTRTGGLCVSFAGPDGRVLGGRVTGLLTAASPIQVTVGSFTPDGKELMKTVNHTVEPTHNLSSFSGSGGGVYEAPLPTAGVNSGSPPTQGVVKNLPAKKKTEGGSPPDNGVV